RLVVAGMVAADGNDEIAGMWRRIPDAHAELALEAENVGIDEIAVRRHAGDEEKMLLVGGHHEIQLEISDRLDAVGQHAEQVKGELLAKGDRDDDLAVDDAEAGELDAGGDPILAVFDRECRAEGNQGLLCVLRVERQIAAHHFEERVVAEEFGRWQLSIKSES